MLEESAPPEPASTTHVPLSRKSTPVIARRPNHAWAVDFTVVPTLGCGSWVPWTPFALPQRWPFAWWVAAVVDLYSRRVMGFAVFPAQPTAEQACTFLARAVAACGAAPKYLVSDLGGQFTGQTYRRWCEKTGIVRRYACKGSLFATAVIERFFLSLESERLWRVPVSLSKVAGRSAVRGAASSDTNELRRKARTRRPLRR